MFHFVSVEIFSLIFALQKVYCNNYDFEKRRMTREWRELLLLNLKKKERSFFKRELDWNKL